MERRRIRVKPYQEDSPSDCLCEKAREGIRVRLGYDRSSPGSSCFLFALVCLIYLLELMAIGTAVRSGLQYAGKQAAKEAYAAPLLQPSSLEADVVESIGAYRLERSLIEGGSGGIHCDSSWMSMGTGIGQITASYQVRIPIPIFSLPLIEYEETMRIKGWTGYEKGALAKRRMRPSM